MNYALIAGVLCLALVLGGCALTLNQVKKDPTAQVIRAISNTIKSLESDLPFTMPKGLDKTGAVDMTVSGIPETEDVTVNLAWAEDAFNLDINTVAMGDNGIFYKNGELALKSDMFLGDDAIGVNMKTLKEDLKDSAILDCFGVTYDELMESIDDLAENNGKEKIENFKNALKDVFVKCETDVTEQTVKTNGEDAKAICVTYNMDKDTYLAFMDAYKDFVTYDMESMDELTDGIKESEAEGKLTFAINPDEKVIMQVSLDVSIMTDGEKDGGTIVLDLGKIPAKSDKFTLVIEDAEVTSSMIYDRTEKDGKFCRNITVKDDETESTLEFIYDKASGDYTLTVNSGEKIVVGGKINSSKSEMNITVDKMEMPGVGDMGLSISLTVKNTADVKGVPEYKNITKMTDDEVDAIMGLFMSFFPSSNGNDYSYLYEFDPTFDYNYDGVVNAEDEEFFNTYYGENSISNEPDYMYEFDSAYDYNCDGAVNADDKAYFDKYYGASADYSYLFEFDPAFDYDGNGKIDADDKEYFDEYAVDLGDFM